MGLRTVFLIALSALILATPVYAASEVESHPYFLALVAAEQCEGHPASIIEELRLAQAMTRDTGKRFSSEDVRAALDQQRSRPHLIECKEPRYVDALTFYRTVLHPMLQGPILKQPEQIG